jgi:hypothetical protein
MLVGVGVTSSLCFVKGGKVDSPLQSMLHNIVSGSVLSRIQYERCEMDHWHSQFVSQYSHWRNE